MKFCDFHFWDLLLNHFLMLTVAVLYHQCCEGIYTVCNVSLGFQGQVFAIWIQASTF